jgi:hypothetical protein
VVSTGRSLQRDRLHWSADVRTVFRGFDNCGTGFISTEDFALALKLLIAPVNADILRDIPQMPDGPGLVAYQPILDYCLVNPSQNQDGDISGGTSVDQLGSIHANHRMTLSASTTDAITKGTTKSTPAVDTALTKLANVVRRALQAFIVEDSTLQAAWARMLRAFHQFDTDSGDGQHSSSNHQGKMHSVTPRDFCLAVSVLMDGDDIVLSTSEWAEIISALTVG